MWYSGSMIKAVIFDKDGTLFNYADFWGPIVSRKSHEGFSRFSISEEKADELAYSFEKIFGVDRFKVNHPNGLLFRHDKIFSGVMRLSWQALKSGLNPYRVSKVLINIIDHINVDKELEEYDFPNVAPLFKALKDRGYVIAVVTNDMSENTMKFLKRMKIDKMVDFLRCRDSGCLNKPNPDSIKELCRAYQIEPSEVAMVGDTRIDMKYGKNGKVGYRIAVMTGCGDRKILEKNSDVVYPTILDLEHDPVLFPERG